MAAGRELEATRKELDQAKQWKGQFESTQARMLELELKVKELHEELNAAIVERDETKEQAKTEKEELEEVLVHSQYIVRRKYVLITAGNKRKIDFSEPYCMPLLYSFFFFVALDREVR